MHILWIENKSKWRDEESELLLSKAENIYTLSEEVLSGSPEDIAAYIFKEYAAVDLYMINLHLLAGSYQRIDNAGIKLLKLLRLHNLRQHCIVYSFFTREQFMQLSAQNLILFSGATSFCQLPFDFLTIPYHGLIEQKAPKDIRPYLKAEFDLPDERHMMANWWGVLQLWKVHKALCRIEGVGEDEDLNKYLSGSLKEMNSYQGLLARYLYHEEEKDIESRLKILQQNQVEKFGKANRNIDLIKSVLEDKTSQYDQNFNSLQLLEEFFKDRDEKTIIQSILEKLKIISDPINQKINTLLDALKTTSHEIELLNEYIELDTLIKDERINIERKNDKLDHEIQDLTLRLEKTGRFNAAQFDYKTSSKTLKNKSPKIIYVDDQAEEGWAFVLQNMIYGGPNKAFSIIVPQNNDEVEDIAADILKRYNELTHDLIILDLRLKGEHGSIVDPEKISGLQVLQILNKQKINCPILIVSASNKFYSFTESFRMNASAYWMKEGLEDQRNLDWSIENYLHLLDKITVLCTSKEYMFLSKFKSFFNRIKNNEEPFWWENIDWISSKAIYAKSVVTIERDELTEIIGKSVQLLDDYLKIRMQSSVETTLDSTTPSLIVTKLSQILELIHRTDNSYKTIGSGKERLGLSEKMRDQIQGLNRITIDLLNIRNKAVHLQNCTFSDMQYFVLILFQYLFDYRIFLQVFSKKGPPVDGKKYISFIETVDNNYSTRFYLKNCGLDLFQRNIIMDTRQQYNPQLSNLNLSPGDKIEFVLLLIKEGDNTKYYARNAKKIN
jgi:CheY-like chemotaxis protein